MMRDFTIGQHFPGDSIVHRADPRVKLILTLVSVIAVFFIQSAIGLALYVAFILSLYLIAKIKLRILFKSLKSILPLLIFMMIFNLIFFGGKTVLLDLGIFTIYTEGVISTLYILVRIVFLLSVTSLLTFTTSPIILTDSIEFLLSPGGLFREQMHDLAMMMTLALRFIPTLIEETDKIMSAQKARGADTETGGLIKRVRGFIPIIVPLLLSSYTRASELATAMDCRCYNSSRKHTKLNPLRFRYYDGIILVIYTAFTAGVILFNYL